MKYKIVSDSSSDVFSLDCVEYTTVPLKIITDEKQFIDTPDLDVSEMIDYLKKYKGTSKSSCPNMDEWYSAFGDADAVFCIPITKNLSGSHNSAVLAVNDFLEEHPEKKAYVIDTLTTGPECELIIEKLCELIESGLSFDEIKDEICKYRQSTHLHFCLESLRNFANNGRVSHTTAKMAGILGIRVIGQASLEGTLEIQTKVRGGDKAIDEIYERMKANGYCGGKVSIHHCQNPEGAEKLASIIRNDHSEASVKIGKTGALCSFYAESGGLLIGYEGAEK